MNEEIYRTIAQMRADARVCGDPSGSFIFRVADCLEAIVEDLELDDDHDGWDSSIYTAALHVANAYRLGQYTTSESEQEQQ